MPVGLHGRTPIRPDLLLPLDERRFFPVFEKRGHALAFDPCGQSLIGLPPGRSLRFAFDSGLPAD
jgi:hypothetical protein